jgi:small subunit ribosomal protein S6
LAENLYEAMFVVDIAKGGSEFPGVISHIADIINRQGADIDRIEKWEERKFAYPIKGVKRGIYILCYFTAEGEAISEIRRLFRLSEQVLRVLILKTDTKDEIRGELYNAEGEMIAEAPAEPIAPVVTASAAQSGESSGESEEEDEEE